MTGEQLEYSLSQYHDNTLAPLERASVDELLATDSDARELLAEYQRLDALMRLTPALPEMNWDRLREQISSAVSNEEIVVPSFKIGVWTRRLAVAASILLAVGISIPMLRHQHALPRSSKISVEISAVDNAGIAQNTSHADVSIGPSPAVADSAWRYDDAFVTRPSSVAIAVTPEPAQDTNTSAPF